MNKKIGCRKHTNRPSEPPPSSLDLKIRDCRRCTQRRGSCAFGAASTGLGSTPRYSWKSQVRCLFRWKMMEHVLRIATFRTWYRRVRLKNNDLKKTPVQFWRPDVPELDPCPSQAQHQSSLWQVDVIGMQIRIRKSSKRTLWPSTNRSYTHTGSLLSRRIHKCDKRRPSHVAVGRLLGREGCYIRNKSGEMPSFQRWQFGINSMIFWAK